MVVNKHLMTPIRASRLTSGGWYNQAFRLRATIVILNSSMEATPSKTTQDRQACFDSWIGLSR